MTLRCKEPGCPNEASTGPLTAQHGQCHTCLCTDRCAVKQCPNVEALNGLCRVCAAVLHPGCVWYRGRWRPIREFNLRIMRDPAMKGVQWTVEGTDIVGHIPGTNLEYRLRGKLLYNPEAKP